MRVMIVGAGIGGLTTALSLHQAGLDFVVVESAEELRPLGVGINLQPHAVRELTELGLDEALRMTGIPTTVQIYANRLGQPILTLPRGQAAGYRWPQYSIHRGHLQSLLADALLERAGSDVLRLGLEFQDYEQDGTGVTVRLREVRTGQTVTERADVLIGADGVRSTVRARMHPEDGPLQWSGIRMWRGMTETDPFLDGGSMVVAGCNVDKKFVAYPVCARTRERGKSLVNWVAELTVAKPGPLEDMSAWHSVGGAEEALAHFGDWRFPYLDVGALIAGAERVLEYPMVDKDPLPFWTDGRVTLLGDAAHPMYPVGSNGGSQAILDARVLAYTLATCDDPAQGLARYEELRREPTAELALANRALPMDKTIRLVEERAPDGFSDIADVLTPEELAEMAQAQKQTTDMDVKTLNERPSWSVRQERG